MIINTLKCIVCLCLFISTQTLAQETTTILDENFDNNNNGWAISNYPEGTFEIKNGYYYFDHNMSSGAWVNAIPVTIPSDADWEMETKIKTIQSISLWTFGLVWGRDDKGNDYEFTINRDGDYSLEKQENYTMSNLAFERWMPSEHLEKGNGATNILKIVKEGDELTFFINGKEEIALPYMKPFGNVVGFKINRNQKIAIDYLKIKVTKLVDNG